MDVNSHVYVFGSGDCGQLGLGEDVDVLARPRLHPYFEDKSIVAISAGGLHTLALSSTGIALGHGAPEFTVAPVEGPLKGQTVIQIAAGDSISAALTSEGRVYSWGTFRDSKGVIGHHREGELTILQEVPTLLESLSSHHIVSISAGSNHLMAVDREGQLFAWGCGEQGQLGKRVLERHKLLALRPTLVTPRLGRHRVRVQRVVCGSYHTLLIAEITSGSALFSMGLNNFGQLALGDHMDRLTPELVDSPPWSERIPVDAAAGEHHSIILTDDGRVWSCGRADSGQLGIDLADAQQRATTIAQPVSTLPGPVRLIAAGGNHNMAVSQEGQLYTWGYGEMHQLGHGPDEIERYPRLVQSQFQGNISQISAGGQHSVVLSIE